MGTVTSTYDLVYGNHNPSISWIDTTKNKRYFGASLLQNYGIVGCGKYAEVRLMKHNTNNLFYAIKRLEKKKIYEIQNVEKVENEIRILNSLNHPFIIGFYNAFQNVAHVCLVTEYCVGGELFHRMQTRGGHFEVKEAIFYASEIALALSYLHEERGVVWRDLKPENILIADNGHVKLGEKKKKY